MSTLLLLLAMCGAARADDVLIYKGVLNEEATSNGQAAGGSNAGYFLMDLTSPAQLDEINYGSIKSVRKYVVGSSTPITLGHVTISKTRAQLVLVTGTAASTGTSADYLFLKFAGTCTRKLDFGGTEMLVPGEIKVVGSILSTTSGTDPVASFGLDFAQEAISGAFPLQAVLTQASITDGDTLPQAVTRVTNYLEGLGYTKGP